MDINKIMAETRAEADMLYKTSKNMNADAAALYARIEKIHAASQVLIGVKNRLLSMGDPHPEETIDAILEDSLAAFVERL